MRSRIVAREGAERRPRRRRYRAHVHGDHPFAQDLLQPFRLAAVVADNDALVTQLLEPPELAAQEVELPSKGGLRTGVDGDSRLALPALEGDARLHPLEGSEPRDRPIGWIEE